MATLVFEVEADYEKVIRLRDEIARLEVELNKVAQNGTPEEIGRLESQLESCRAEIKNAVAVASQLGNEIEQGIAKKAQDAGQDMSKFGDEIQNALSGIKEMDFGTAQEKIDALSYAIYNNEVVLADSVKQLQQWREDARQAFETGDTGTLKAITKDINDQISKIQALTSETQEYRTALTQVFEASGLGTGDTAVVRLFDSEEEIRHVEELQQKVVDLRAEIAQVGASGGDTTALTQALTATTDELNECQLKATQTAQALGSDLGARASEAQQQLYALNNAISEQNDVIDDLQARVDEARDAFDTLSRSEGASADEIERASASYQTLADALTQAQEKMAMLKGQQQEAQQQMNAVNKEIDLQSNVIVKMCGGYDNFKSAISLLPAPLQATVNGIVSMTSASMKFILTPVGATIAAIALALQALHTWFTKSAEGQRAFAKVTGLVNGVLGQLTEIVLKVGKYIYEAFTNPKKVIQDFGKLLESQVMNRVNAVGGMFSALGKIMKSVFSGQFDEAGKAVKELGKQYTQAITGVENFGDKASKAMSKFTNAVKGTMDVESAELALREKRSQQEVRNSEYDKQIAELRNQALQGTDEERMEATQKAMDLINKKYDEEVALAQEAYDLQKKRNSLTTNAIEDNEKLNQLEAQRNQLEAQRQQAQTRFLRQQNGIERRQAGTSSTTSRNTAQEEQARVQAQQQANQRLLALQEANQQAEIDLMDEGTEKKLAQIEYSYKLQIAKIEELAKEMAEANVKAGIAGTDGNGLTREQQEGVDKATENANAERVKAEQAVYDAEKDAMYKFLREYGTYEQQRLAITEQYAKKIADASNIYERMSLTNQRNQELQELDMKFSDKTDWGAIFSRIDQYSNDYLQKLKGQLETMLQSDDVTVEQAKIIGDRIAQIEKTLIDRTTSWRDLLGMGNEKLRETQKLQSDLNNLYEQRNRAEEEQNRLLADMDTLRQAIVDYAEAEVNVKLVVDDVDLATASDVLEQMQDAGATSEQTGTVSDMFTQWANLQNQSQQLGNTIQGLDTSIEGTEDALGALGEGAGGAAGAIAIIDKIIHAVNQSVQSMVELLDQLDLGDTKFAEGWKDFAESSEYATKGWESLKSGDPIGVISGVVGSLSSLGNAIGKWTGSSLFGESDVDLHKDIERLTISNNDLANAIDGLTGKISDSTTSFADALTEYELAMANIQQMEANTQEMMQRSAAAYNSGFLGIGGSHSSNVKIDNAMTYADWQRISDIVGESITSASDFWTLSSKQMYEVSVQATDLYSKIKQYADDGYEDAAQYMDDYIAYWKEAEEVLNTYNEKITNISFDNLTSNFKSAISDMSKTTADFADDFEDMMKEAVVSSLMSDKYAQALQDWYNDFALAMENDGLDATEQQKLKDSYMDIVNDARDELEGLYDTLGWSRTSYSQQGTSGGWETMSEDTGQELNGRFTALQDIGVQMLTESKGQSEWLSRIHDINSEILPILANSYLELQMISENTASTVTQLVQTVRYLKSVKENTDKL